MGPGVSILVLSGAPAPPKPGGGPAGAGAGVSSSAGSVTVFFSPQDGQVKEKGLPKGSLAVGGMFSRFWQ
jgi:hypothetical protein